MLAGFCNKAYFKPNDPETKKYMQDDFGMNVTEYFVLSPGGCMSEKREEYAIGDTDIASMGTGDCFVKDANGNIYKFKVE